MTPQNPLIQLRERFEAIRPDVEAVFQGDAAALKRVRETADKLEKDANSGQLNTLVFGQYNAGKSTFINALLGREAAPMGDVPLTASIDRYDWQGHVLCDSPGIDAPIEHEHVTDGFIERECNAVVHVIATGGGIEEAATWERLCRFVSQKKAVLIVVNDKSGYELHGADFAQLRNTIYDNMQSAARKLGLDDPLERIDVLHVKARTALKARLEGKQGLLHKSGILEAETVLRRFLEASTEKILASDRERARTLVNEAIAELSSQAGSETGRQLAACRSEIEGERMRMESALVEAVRTLAEREIESLHATVSRIGAQEADVGGLLTSAFEHSQARLVTVVEKQLHSELEHIEAVVRRVTEMLNNQLKLANVDIAGVELKAVALGPAGQGEAGGEDIAAAILKQVKELPVGDLTENGIKLILKQGKEWFPKLFKGIGSKTMGKWAGVAGMAAGPLLMVLQSGYELYQAHREEEQARERHRQFVVGLMSTVRQAFGDAVEQYELMFKRITKATLDPVLDALDRQALALKTVSKAHEATRGRLADWTRELDT
jgi:ABC-type hemin transport system ATPase subunit